MIVVVEDEALLRMSIADFLGDSGLEVEAFERAEDALRHAKTSAPDLVITDLQLPGMSGFELIEALGKVDPSIVRILMTAHASVESAVAAMRLGCYEYLEKPVDLPKLERLVVRALGEKRRHAELAWHRATAAEAPVEILGDSPAMRDLRGRIQTLARLGDRSPPVLITGETGVGKSLVARALHRARYPTDRPWIEVNCATLPPTLIESELFGHERSAFTDAKEAKPGLFEAASDGMIFLDEIGELPLDVQAKLLTVVESGRYRRIGAVRERQSRAAVVAATNVDLDVAVERGRFRRDLYHRLAAFTLSIPPLRARREDIAPIARATLAGLARRYRRDTRGLSDDARQLVERARWPGNVRELQFTLERALLLADPSEPELTAEHLTQAGVSLSPLPRTSLAPPPALGLVPAATLVDLRGGVRVELPDEGVDFDEIERAVLIAALAKTDYNVVRAAKLLGLKRDAMRYRIQKLGIEMKGS